MPSSTRWLLPLCLILLVACGVPAAEGSGGSASAGGEAAPAEAPSEPAAAPRSPHDRLAAAYFRVVRGRAGVQRELPGDEELSPAPADAATFTRAHAHVADCVAAVEELSEARSSLDPAFELEVPLEALRVTLRASLERLDTGYREREEAARRGEQASVEADWNYELDASLRICRDADQGLLALLEGLPAATTGPEAGERAGRCLLPRIRAHRATVERLAELADLEREAEFVRASLAEEGSEENPEEVSDGQLRAVQREALESLEAAWVRGGPEGAAAYLHLRGVLGEMSEGLREAQQRATEACADEAASPALGPGSAGLPMPR